MYIKIKLIENQKNDLVSGTFYLETYSKKFVDEIKKFICPFRLSMYLTKEENKLYTSLSNPLSIDKYNLSIDLSSKTNEIINKKIEAGQYFSLIPEAYIESTPHLDEYGNQIINDEIYIIEYLYNHDKSKTVLFNEKVYTGWKVNGYDTIEKLKSDFPLDADVKTLYEADV